jgi:hypothetical protein
VHCESQCKDDIGKDCLPGIVLAADQDDGGVRAEPPDLVNPHVPQINKK